MDGSGSLRTATETLNSTRQGVKERVRTYNESALADLLAESQALRSDPPASSLSPGLLSHSSSARLGSSRVHSPAAGATRDPTIAERAAAQLALKEQQRQERIEMHRKRMERRRQDDTERKELEFQGMYQDVLDGLMQEGIMGEAQASLDHSAKIKERKKHQLHEEWSREVFDKIQDRLQTSVNALDTPGLETRLRTQMGEYLHATNTKLGVYRDVIIEQDYNPMRSHSATIRIPTGDIRDPVKRDVLKPMYEAQLMGRSLPATPLGKPTLDTQTWAALQIGASPYGHCVDKDGNYIVRPVSGKLLEIRKSHIPMDHYNYPTDNASAATELGRIGKGMPPGPEVRRGRQDLFDVVQQTVDHRPGFTGGDRWMEAKGKAMPENPAVKRGCAPMETVIQQSSNPYNDGKKKGDIWMEAKGKQRPPGPEETRGRRGLGEILHQTSNFFQDGRTLGDAFLEQKGKASWTQGQLPTIGPIISSQQGAPDPQPTNKMGAKRAESHLVNNLTLTVKGN